MVNISSKSEKSYISTKHCVKKQVFVALLVTVICTWILFQLDQITGDNLIINIPRPTEERISVGFLVNTIGCRIPNLDPFEPSIGSYFFKDPVDCDPLRLGQLVKATTTKLYIDQKHLNVYLNGSENPMECCYRPFWRITLATSDFSKADEVYNFSDKCHAFSSPVIIPHEFIKVVCKSGGKVLYKDYFAFVQEKENKTLQTNNRTKVSVLIVGVDAVSRLNLYRQMPLTLRFLEDAGAVEMLGYNKVGDNTFPNLLPILSGMTETEVSETCWKKKSDVFDNCKFVWNLYQDNGYYTGFAEDSANIGLFNYLKNGFRKQPTDYYHKTFSTLSEKDIGHEHRLNTDICLGKRMTCEALLDAAKSFALNLKNYLSFGFFWGNSISHDYINLPGNADKIYHDLLTQLKDNGILQNTVFIFLSDHGIRWGSFRRTYHGYLEERLPFLYILYPKWFVEEFPYAVTNLRRNHRKLTTPFDLHETITHLLDLSMLKNKEVKTLSKSMESSRGISLFLPIPEGRTCNDAKIPQNWCTCHEQHQEEIGSLHVKNSVNILLIYFRKMLSGYRQCSELALSRVIKARSEKIEIKEAEAKSESITDYIVTIETKPGLALFEATVRFSLKTKEYVVLPPVSRINLYGNQSNCVSDYHLKLYCYCS